MECRIIRHGSSSAMVIPPGIMEMMGLNIGDKVKVPFHEFEVLKDQDKTTESRPDRYVGRLGGHPIDITSQDIISALNELKPENCPSVRTYYLKHDGKRLPTKTIISKASGVESFHFNSIAANTVLEGLGFEVQSTR